MKLTKHLYYPTYNGKIFDLSILEKNMERYNFVMGKDSRIYINKYGNICIYKDGIINEYNPLYFLKVETKPHDFNEDEVLLDIRELHEFIYSNYYNKEDNETSEILPASDSDSTLYRLIAHYFYANKYGGDTININIDKPNIIYCSNSYGDWFEYDWKEKKYITGGLGF